MSEGRLIMSTLPLESAERGSSACRLFLALIERLMPERPVVRLDPPDGVTVTLRHQIKLQRFVISLLAPSHGGTPWSARDMIVKLHLRGRRATAVRVADTEAELAFSQTGAGDVTIAVPAFQTLLVFVLNYAV